MTNTASASGSSTIGSVVGVGVTVGMAVGVFAGAFAGSGVSVDWDEFEDSDAPVPLDDTSSGSVSIAPTTRLLVDSGAGLETPSGDWKEQLASRKTRIKKGR